MATCGVLCLPTVYYGYLSCTMATCSLLTTVVATDTSTIFTENLVLNADNVVMQSVMMTVPSDCEELHKYFGIITFKAVTSQLLIICIERYQYCLY